MTARSFRVAFLPASWQFEQIKSMHGFMKNIFILTLGLLFAVLPADAGQRVFDVGEGNDYASLCPTLDTGKLYAGRLAHTAENQIVLDVFSVDAKGNPSASPRTYEIAVPPPVNDKYVTQWRSIIAIARHPNKKKLYLGYAEPFPNEDHKYLVVFDLDAKGEPTGKPRILYVGHVNNSVTGFAVDEKDKILYMIGWGLGLFGYPLDDNGEPKGDSFMKTGFSHGSYSSIFAEDFSSVIYGDYGCFAYALLDHKATNDALEKPPEYFTVPGNPNYVGLACAGETLFVANMTGDATTAALYTWPLDKATMKPQGLGAQIPKVHPIMIAQGTRKAAYVATQPSVDEGVPKGFQLLKFEPTPLGQLPVPKNLGSEYEGMTLKAIAVDEATGNIYICARSH